MEIPVSYSFHSKVPQEGIVVAIPPVELVDCELEYKIEEKEHYE